MSKEVTVIQTSSGRFDLLRITIESFLLHNTFPIKEWIISDDSGQQFPKELEQGFPFINFYTTEETGILKNQIDSLDFLWAQVHTEYVFQKEDDWEFTKEGFIEHSLAILDTNPDILQVWLIQPEEHNVSPIEWGHTAYNWDKVSLLQFGIFKRMPQLWSWHRFNPGLKRKADYDLIAPFSKHTTFNPAKPWKAEADISQVYHRLGYTAAILNEPYMRHIGGGRHVGV